MLEKYYATDYYDLIELPNGRHIPVPIAKRLIGLEIVDRIPMSRKHRDDRFFYCAQCDQNQKRIIEGTPDNTTIALTNGHSFYKCKLHNPFYSEELKQKEDMLVRLVLNGMYKSLRYVSAVTVPKAGSQEDILMYSELKRLEKLKRMPRMMP